MTDKNTRTDKKQKTPRTNKTKIVVNKYQQLGGNNNDICSKDINKLLTTNKDIFTYNNEGDQTDKLINQTSLIEKDATTGWGNNPGPPPDPKSCIIM
jgi:hypothetical protein